MLKLILMNHQIFNNIYLYETYKLLTLDSLILVSLSTSS